MKKALAGLLFVAVSMASWALPSEEQVQDALKAGQYTQAQSMMAEVVAAKPGSAKAHYVYAEILAHNGAFNKAAEETAKAKQIDPAIKFTDPDKFRSFESTLSREQNQPAPRSSGGVQPTSPTYAPSSMSTSSSTGGGIPGWIWIVGLVILAVVLWRGFARSRMAGGMPMQGGGQAGYGPSGMNQGYGPAGYGPGGMPAAQPRSGLLGTGLAVAGGVAGGMLLDEALHHRDGGSGGGGIIPDAYADNGAARDLENRPVDFGNGNDWDSGGGSADFGGGGDSGGGGDWS